tara:strand:+ start:265 stop:486 length:222 start_codon:yes stop_codon:yes gene_type:complete
VRDYKREYKKFHSSVSARKARSLRVMARRKKKLKVGDPREVDHKKPLSKGGGNGSDNLRVVSRSTNRKKGKHA